MSAQFDRSAYLRRFAVSLGVVGVSAIPMFLLDGAGGLLSPWCWVVVLHDVFHILPLPAAGPVLITASVLGTLAVIAAAALRPTSTAIATAWLAANALALWALLATFKLEPAG
jgi:hypothetical protein